MYSIFGKRVTMEDGTKWGNRRQIQNLHYFPTKWCVVFFMNKVSLQTSLERNSINLSYISILSVNFENLTVRSHVLIIFFMHVKFQKDQKSIAISSTNVKISNFYDLKLYIKNKFIDRIVNNIQFKRNLICM